MDHHHIVVLGTELGALAVLIALGIWRMAVTHDASARESFRPGLGTSAGFDMRRDGQRLDY